MALAPEMIDRLQWPAYALAARRVRLLAGLVRMRSRLHLALIGSGLPGSISSSSTRSACATCRR